MNKFLYQLLAPFTRIFLKNQIGAKPIRGSQKILHYPKDQFLGFLLRNQICYEEEIQKQILPCIQEGNLIFEIGSNIGQYTLLFSERIGPAGQVIAIEPDSDNFAFLSFNCIKNQCQNVQLLHAAVSNEKGKSTFFKDTITGGRTSSLYQEFTASNYRGQQEEVLVTTLNELIEQYGIPDFVKVDVEGAEELIFNEKAQIDPRTIYFIEVRKETSVFIFDRFHLLGFSIYHIDDQMKEILQPSSLPDVANLLILKRSE